jgi:hypothetical protein
MKQRIVLGILFSLLFATWGHTQAIEITPTYGYQLGGKLKYGSNYLKADDSGMFGITLGFEAQTDYMIEVSYLNMSTELPECRLVYAGGDAVFWG